MTTFGELKCEVCGIAGSVVAMHRANPKGEKGRWRCEPCLTTPPSREVLAVTDWFETTPMTPETVAWVRAQRTRDTTRCPKCDGTGKARGHDAPLGHPDSACCLACDGVGRVTPGGETPCPECGGTGRDNADVGRDGVFNCSRCRGSGCVTPGGDEPAETPCPS